MPLESKHIRILKLWFAEDDQNAEVANLLKQYSDLDILHIFYPDNGLQKNVIQNKACAVNGDYLIFMMAIVCLILPL